ncbi:branched-chain amino acid ABC-type transport system, permease component [Halogeometricum borinquense DSM 11551]|uniref:Branched-chain amino acid ABC-type transport system, permease component n=1 Tax=Halogeometricum borinquense (strain ATCC 700274 / DSM 11551 / JCM 10706 / KCTC 4070 / PR3) TaxID=469382 RepID=E4NWC4_HALBP|nr:ABC transporter permease [Halogeometricum borinquense]ADQ69344.1 branched-chain amino acid ABC-type transport system, permease component [Halogeometricum borinquense DSM 11551]ELY26235.1 branched-chain amino acid ABC-type transport system, permease component [Halogeometricum borinquense DSM 11551]
MSVATAVAEQVLNGLTVGMVYVLLAAGLSIIFGVMDVINFAHGELFALGAYFAFAIAAPLGGAGFWVALVAAPLLVAVVGMGIERLAVRRLYGRDPLYHILLTFGLVLIINDLITAVWGKAAKPFPIPAALDQPVTLLGFTYSLYNYGIVIFGAMLAIGTWLLLNRTKFGMIIRAGSQDREMVRNLGINVDTYYTLTFGFGAALAGVAGIVLGAFQNVSPTMGNSVIIPAFVIVVLGGLGSFRGAVVGGLFVGVVQTLARTYTPFLEGLIVFLLMIAVLLVRPNGLFGSAVEESHEGALLHGSGGGVLSPAARKKLGYAVVTALAVVPLFAELTGITYAVTLLEDMLIWALFALSLDLVLGYAGLVSLGHALFYGVGAYAAVLSLMHVTPSVFVALAVAIIVCAAIAWVIGYLSIRVSGVFFAMITLAFAQLFYNAVFKFKWTGGSDGLFGVDTFYGLAGVGIDLSAFELAFGPVILDGGLVRYYFLVLVVVGGYLLARRLIRAPFGTVLQAIRESEERASFVGYDVTAYKRRAFVVSGGLAGLAGGLFAANNGYVAPSFLHWIHSGEVIVMTVLGGMGTLYGPMLGAGVFVAFEDILSSYIDQWQLVIGTLFVLFVIFVPRGLVSLPRTVLDHPVVESALERRRPATTETEAEHE